MAEVAEERSSQHLVPPPAAPPVSHITHRSRAPTPRLPARWLVAPRGAGTSVHSSVSSFAPSTLYGYPVDATQHVAVSPSRRVVALSAAPGVLPGCADDAAGNMRSGACRAYGWCPRTFAAVRALVMRCPYSCKPALHRIRALSLLSSVAKVAARRRGGETVMWNSLSARRACRTALRVRIREYDLRTRLFVPIYLSRCTLGAARSARSRPSFAAAAPAARQMLPTLSITFFLIAASPPFPRHRCIRQLHPP
ncbi:hypothetical protein C8J57DRAFT_1510718 [Mycena rebaudengoi]|nr:hypothetical protein C8J57DRAFT_1510718 [Mycena rebaudengoi]